MNHSIHLTKSAIIPLQMCPMGNIQVANVNRVTTAKPYVEFMPSYSGAFFVILRRRCGVRYWRLADMRGCTAHVRF